MLPILATTACRADVALPPLFSDNMVLQRSMATPIWGSASPGEKVAVAFNGQTAATVAGASGAWTVHLKMPRAGGPYTLTATGRNTVTVNNVLVGDVWLCSGQSNMTFSLGMRADLYASDIAAASDPDLRCFTVERTAALDPQAGAQGSWVPATQQTVPGFTAVGYYFARQLRKTLGVPIGLIHASYGGTQGESWVSIQALDNDPVLKQIADQQIAAMRAQAANEKAFAVDTPKWQADHGATDPGNLGFAQGWASPGFDTRSWMTRTTQLSLGQLGLKGGGVIWYRKEFQVPQTASKDFYVQLGYGPPVFDVYFNGTLLKENNSVAPFYPRPLEFRVPAALIKPGQPNVLAIRMTALLDTWGIWVTAADMGLPGDASHALDNTWQVKVEQGYPALTDADRASLPTPPTAQMQNTASTLFNAMIAPLIPYGLKGAIWYQGESNAGRAGTYGHLLPALIGDWRSRWAQGDFPFYIVQLANFGDPSGNPAASSGWAQIREAQLHASETVPNTGLAVTIDLGEAHDIHPVRKAEVGDRLARIALNRLYGRPQTDSGPVYAGFKIEGAQIRLSFRDLGGGLVARGGALTQFAIAGADRKFVWADAKIDGNTVVVSSAQVSQPVAVRYAWADNPEGCNLYNAAGLPASPFRTDDFSD